MTHNFGIHKALNKKWITLHSYDRINLYDLDAILTLIACFNVLLLGGLLHQKNCFLDRWDEFGSEFPKVRLGQHLGGSLEKVLCKTHLERTLTRVKVLKIFWRQFNIFTKVILQEENTSIYRKKMKYPQARGTKQKPKTSMVMEERLGL